MQTRRRNKQRSANLKKRQGSKLMAWSIRLRLSFVIQVHTLLQTGALFELANSVGFVGMTTANMKLVILRKTFEDGLEMNEAKLEQKIVSDGSLTVQG